MVMEAKAKIQEKTGVPLSLQRLLLGGHQLADSNHLMDYGLRRGDRLCVVYLLRGGMQNPGAHILPSISTGEGGNQNDEEMPEIHPPKLAF